MIATAIKNGTPRIAPVAFTLKLTFGFQSTFISAVFHYGYSVHYVNYLGWVWTTLGWPLMTLWRGNVCKYIKCIWNSELSWLCRYIFIFKFILYSSSFTLLSCCSSSNCLSALLILLHRLLVQFVLFLYLYIFWLLHPLLALLSSSSTSFSSCWLFSSFTSPDWSFSSIQFLIFFHPVLCRAFKIRPFHNFHAKMSPNLSLLDILLSCCYLCTCNCNM